MIAQVSSTAKEPTLLEFAALRVLGKGYGGMAGVTQEGLDAETVKIMGRVLAEDIGDHTYARGLQRDHEGVYKQSAYAIRDRRAVYAKLWPSEHAS